MKRTRMAAMLTVGLALGSVVMIAGPAHAESGYRVCGVWNSSRIADGFGTGLVTKVWKDDNTNTCQQKIDFMTRYYGVAYRGSSVKHTFFMDTCEDFSTRTLMPESDICPDLDVNKIYKYSSAEDRLYPTEHPGVSFWHN